MKKILKKNNGAHSSESGSKEIGVLITFNFKDRKQEVMKITNSRRQFELILQYVDDIPNQTGLREFCVEELFIRGCERLAAEEDNHAYHIKILATFPEMHSVLDRNPDTSLAFILHLFAGDYYSAGYECIDYAKWEAIVNTIETASLN